MCTCMYVHMYACVLGEETELVGGGDLLEENGGELLVELKFLSLLVETRDPVQELAQLTLRQVSKKLEKGLDCWGLRV